MVRDRKVMSSAPSKKRKRQKFLAFEFLDARMLLSASITDLGPLTGGNVTGVNSDVNVAGTKVVSTNTDVAFLIDLNGVTHLLGSLPGYGSSDATGLNASGQVVGYAASSAGLGGGVSTNGFLYSDGKLSAIGTLGGSDSEANGINDSGQVVGWANTTTGQDAFLYSNGQLTDVGGLPGATASAATAINDSGQIVGYSSISGGSGGGVITPNAFLYEAGKFIDLGTPSERSSAYGINALGQVVGSNGGHGFLWDNGVMMDLGTLPDDDTSLAESINDSGQIVGYATESGGFGNTPSHAFLYENGVMSDLNSLLPANSGWVLNTATAIDNAGDIVGMGTLNGLFHGYRLNTAFPNPTPTPTPTPSPTPNPTPTPTPAPTPTLTPVQMPTPTGLTSPKPAAPPKPTPGLTVQPKLPISGPFRTRTSLTIKPKAATFGRPIILIAKVKNHSRARVDPTGSVTFVEGDIVLGSVTLHGGKARLTTSGLPVGKDPLQVFYAGSANFVQSASPNVVERVGQNHASKPLAHQLNAKPDGGTRYARSGPVTQSLPPNSALPKALESR
jgi:probable HAF family extracellular repeat protein